MTCRARIPTWPVDLEAVLDVCYGQGMEGVARMTYSLITDGSWVVSTLKAQ